MQEELNNKIEELSSRLSEQDEKILALEEKPVMLDRYLDNQSKDILATIIEERIKDIVVGEFPNSIYKNYLSFGGTATINSTEGFANAIESGIIMNVKPILNNEIMFRRNDMDLNGTAFSWSEPFSFKTSVYMSYGDASDITFANTEIYIIHGERDANLGYAGFKILGADIKGVLKEKNGSSEILTSSLQTFVNENAFDLRVDHDGTGTVTFYINDERVGFLNVGSLGDSHPNHFNFTLKTTSTPKTISTSTNASPIEITTSTSHSYATGDFVTITNHSSNTNANSTAASPSWQITVVNSTKFTLDGSTTTGTTGSGGTVDYEKQLHISHVDYVSGLTR